jgi:hypothetical protein
MAPGTESITEPMNSLGVMMSAATIGSTSELDLALGELARIGDVMQRAVLGVTS